MNEVEKMYENAGLKKYNYMLCDNDFQCDGNCVNCEYQPTDNKLSFHPPFTAEKQLEFVKFMLHKGIYYDTDGDTYWFHYTDEIENATYRPFEEAIAEFINGFWQFLTEKERKQIKEILNGL